MSKGKAASKGLQPIQLPTVPSLSNPKNDEWANKTGFRRLLCQKWEQLAQPQGAEELIKTFLETDTVVVPGRMPVTVDMQLVHENAGDRLHGGAITSLVDIIGSAAIFSMGVPYSGVSVDINVTFMAGAPLGEEIEIEAKALRVGKTLAFVVVDIRLKATGKLVAQGRHTKFLGPSGTSVSRL
ncbi:hypothetical protein L7F22_002059 [Adiantum nelumboides]|nr:hypothetical protein [Adiantum nelumboides]